MTVEKLYAGNHNAVYWNDMTDEGGDPVTDATVAWELLDKSGAALDPPATGTLTHVADGTYRGVIAPGDFGGQAVGTVLLRKITATRGGDSGDMTDPVVVSYRPRRAAC